MPPLPQENVTAAGFAASRSECRWCKNAMRTLQRLSERQDEVAWFQNIVQQPRELAKLLNSYHAEVSCKADAGSLKNKKRDFSFASYQETMRSSEGTVAELVSKYQYKGGVLGEDARSKGRAQNQSPGAETVGRQPWRDLKVKRVLDDEGQVLLEPQQSFH